MKRTIYFILGLLTLSLSAQSQDSDYSFKDSFKATEPLNLTISSNDSDIEVIASEGNKLEVLYLVTKSDNVLNVTKEELKDMTEGQWKLDILETSKGLEIKVVSTVKKGFIRHEDKINVHFKVYAPKETSTVLKSHDGDIKIQGLTLDQKCISNDGDIHLIDLKGKVYAQTSDGDVLVTNVTGSLETITHDGSVIDLTNEKI